jgi:hypothetical protein
MGRYLIKTTETWRVDTVADALAMREEMSSDLNYDLNEFKYTEKYDKKSDEEYVLVTVKKNITTEKEPKAIVRVVYEA